MMPPFVNNALPRAEFNTREEDKLGNIGACKWDYGGGTKLAKSSTAAEAVGNIGMWNWSGQNSFANFRVTDHAGTVLYSNDFTDDTLDQIPDGWSEWDNTVDWVPAYQVKADVTHPLGRVVQATTGGNYDSACYCTEYTPPADNKYIITVDVKVHAAHALFALGPLIYQSAPGTFKSMGFQYDGTLTFAQFGSPALVYRKTDVDPDEDVWYSLKIVVDGMRMWGFVKTMAEADYHLWLTYNWGKTINLFEAPGPLARHEYGTVKQLYIIRNDIQAMTLNIYYDGDATPTITMPLDVFFNGQATAPYATRYVGQSTIGKSFYRYIDIPYTDGIKIELVNDTDTDTTVWWGIGSLDVNPTLLGKYARLYGEYHAADVAPNAWYTIADITGEGVIYSVYLHTTSTESLGNLEGDIRFLRDGSNTPVYEASGSEDFPLQSFYFSDTIPRCSDFIGCPLKVSAEGDYQAGFYRMFIRDPMAFQTSLVAKWEAGQEGEFTPAGTTALVSCVLYYLTA